MTVSRGYGVTEIYVPGESTFVGKTITDSGIPEHDVNVLTLYRGNKVIPNPKYSRVLEPGDKLLCFGKMESMRKLIPLTARRKRKPKVQQLEEGHEPPQGDD
nr:TrkA C-terminal domain-containing protein [Motiliproteus sp. SC1-56]